MLEIQLETFKNGPAIRENMMNNGRYSLFGLPEKFIGDTC